MSKRFLRVSGVFLFSILFSACGVTSLKIETPLDACAPTGSGLTSGTTVIDEAFNQGAGSSQYTTPVTCWSPFRSSFSGMQDSDFGASFTNTVIGGAAHNVRELTVGYTSGVETNTTVDYAPFTTPDTGWDSGQWPYIMDVHKNPQCYADVTFTSQLKISTQAGGTGMYGVLLNADVTGAGPTRQITGYLLHLNVGGNSATLVKFDHAYDHVTDYLDHFPGLAGRPNPLTDGPYKGWDFKNTAFAAGGSVNGADLTVVGHYQYDLSARTAKLEWELRPGNGADGSPGVYDQVRILSGDDALPPLGGYGVYATLYGSLASPIQCAPDGCSNTVDIGRFRLDCVNP